MIGTGAMLERQFLELKPGETKTINYVRPKGARVRGQLTLPAEKLMGIVVQISSEKVELDPFDKREWTTTYASQTANADGSFLTERVPPGTYVLKADAYVPLTPEQQVRTAHRAPTALGQDRSARVGSYHGAEAGKFGETLDDLRPRQNHRGGQSPAVVRG
jgi:hypothetical protein